MALLWKQAVQKLYIHLIRHHCGPLQGFIQCHCLRLFNLPETHTEGEPVKIFPGIRNRLHCFPVENMGDD